MEVEVRRPPKPCLSSLFTQFFPPTPKFTEKNIEDQSGKVFIVTGSNTGVGKEIAQILYSKNATVYIATRSEEKAQKAIEDIKKAWPKSKGTLIYQHLDLADLITIKPAVEKFKQHNNKLHGLFNNAAVQALTATPPNNVTAQGHEIHLGVNAFGNFLFAKLLTPILVATAKMEPPNTVRVVWVSSLGLEMAGEEHYGITTDYLKYWPQIPPLRRYGISKAANWLYAVEFANRYKADGVVSVPCNPGHLRSDLYRDGSFLFRSAINMFIAYPSIYGAYTELYSAFSPEITIEDTGCWVVPWGRKHFLRSDLEAAKKTESEGGNGHAKSFWEWSEEQVQEYA